MIKMALRLALLCIAILSLKCINGDFFSDIEKLDIDAKLREIDKAIHAMDKGDDPVINKPGVKEKKSKVKTGEETDDFGSAVEMLAGMFGGGECKFQCKNGNKPVAKAEHVPTSNGCGSSGIKVDTDDVPGMEECCHEHDYCYDTCNSDRVTCDKDFKKCLHDLCNKIKTSKTKQRVSYKDCKATSDLMYGGTVALGCDPFLKAQENACSCSQSRINSDKKIKKKVDPANKASSSESVKKDKKDRAKSGRRNDEL